MVETKEERTIGCGASRADFITKSTIGSRLIVCSVLALPAMAFVPSVVQDRQLLVHRRRPHSRIGKGPGLGPPFVLGTQQTVPTTQNRAATAAAAADSDNDKDSDCDSPSNKQNDSDTAKNGAIPEKIRWIFDDADGEFLVDDDEDYDGEEDDFFDDLFLTDDEEFDDYGDDDYGDDGGFITDDNDEDGPDASLSEDDLMALHDMYPDSVAASLSPSPPAATVQPGTGDSSASRRDRDSTAAGITTTTTTTTQTVAKSDPPQSNNDTVVSLDNILATLESDLSYFYLRDELGISEDIMWKITNDAPSVLGLKANNVRNKVRVLQSLVGFTDAEIRQLITSQPTLLQLSAKKNLAPTILYWIRQLEIGKKELKTLILGCPALLKYARANIHGKLVFFQTTMGYSLSECRKILIQDPRLMMCSVKNGLIPRLNFLHKEVEIPLSDIRKIALKNPRILRMSVEANLTPKCIFYFIMTLQMQNKDVAKMLLKYPKILDYNLEHHILPIHHYFLSLEFSTYEFSRILQRYPRLITYSLMRIKRRIGYLRFELSLEANAIRRILYQCPQIVSLGQENLEETVEFLLRTVAPGASLSDSGSVATAATDDDDDSGSSSGSNSISNGDDAGDTEELAGGDELVDADDRDALAIVQIMVTGLPTLLPLSIENNLGPKVEYLRDRLGQEELSDALLRMPALLGYSLEKRIRPRLERIEEARIPVGKITVGITLREDLFDGWLERQIQNRSKNLLKKQKNKAGSLAKTTAKSKTRSTKTKTNTRSKPTAIVRSPAAEAVADSPATEERGGANGTGTLAETAPGDGGTVGTTGGSRVVEEGGKVIHWRRR